jgi:hypothetical protein
MKIINRIRGMVGAAPENFLRLLSLKRDGQLNAILQNTKFLLRSISDILYQEYRDIFTKYERKCDNIYIPKNMKSNNSEFTTITAAVLSVTGPNMEITGYYYYYCYYYC